jgi:Enoyl-CoA hydratase/isomerase
MENEMSENGAAKVLVERQANVGLIRLNRPEVHNVVDGDVAQAVEAALDEFDADDGVFVVVLTAAGDRAFCAGMDLKAFAREGPRGPYFTEKGGFCGVTRRDLQKPLLVAANGLAVGGGMEIALAADCVVAAEHATFGLAEVKVGLIAGGGGVIRLAKHVGPDRREARLRGRPRERCHPEGRRARRGAPARRSHRRRFAGGCTDVAQGAARDARAHGGRGMGSEHGGGKGRAPKRGLQGRSARVHRETAARLVGPLRRECRTCLTCSCILYTNK